MSLQEQITKDMWDSRKKGDKIKENSLKFLLGEFAREPTKETSNERIFSIIKKTIENEKSLPVPDQGFINTLNVYLPKGVTEEEIADWVSKNINFTELKSKMQAVGLVKKHFGAGADGNIIKKIIEDFP